MSIAAQILGLGHEVKTSMLLLLGSAEKLSKLTAPELTPEISTDPQIAELIDSVRMNGQHVLRLLEVLECAAVGRDRLSNLWSADQIDEFEEFSPLEVAGEVVRSLRVEASERNVELELVRGPGLLEPVRGNSTRIRQILFNLITNAIKYSGRGTVRIHVSGEPGIPRDGHPIGILCMTVEDQGIGLLPSELSSLFDPFRRGAAAKSLPVEGRGLGLHIVKEIVESLGGDVSATACEGTGSRFSIRLPMRLFAADAPQATSGLTSSPILGRRHDDDTPPGLSGRILVVDDDPELLELCCSKLEAAGLDVAAIQRPAQLSLYDITKFDAVLLDLRMPELDGQEVAGLLRRRKFRGPIIAYTANSRTAVEYSRVSLGEFTEIIAKSPGFGEVLRALAWHLRSARASEQCDDRAGNAASATPAAAREVKYTALIERFIARLERDACVAELAVEAKDWDTLRQVAHRLSGSAGHYNFDELGCLATELELVLESSRDLSSAAPLIIERFLEEIQKIVRQPMEMLMLQRKAK